MRAYRKRPRRVHKVQVVVRPAEVDQAQGGQGIPDLGPREHALRSCCLSRDDRDSAWRDERWPRSVPFAADTVRTSQDKGAVLGHLRLLLKDALGVLQRCAARAAPWGSRASGLVARRACHEISAVSAPCCAVMSGLSDPAIRRLFNERLTALSTVCGQHAHVGRRCRQDLLRTPTTVKMPYRPKGRRRPTARTALRQTGCGAPRPSG